MTNLSKKVLSLLLLASLAVSAYAFALERTVKDAARDLSSKPEQIIQFAGIKKGDSILDLLGGNGYYSELLKQKVGPQGQVVLHNNKAYMPYVGQDLKARTERGGLDGVKQIVTEAGDLQLGIEQYDVVFLVLGYHDFYYTTKTWSFPVSTVMPQVLSSLKPGGRLLLIDHNALKGDGVSQVEKLHRIEAVAAKNDIEKQGFKLIKQSNLLENSKDPRNISVFDSIVRRKTDRFVMLFEKK